MEQKDLDPEKIKLLKEKHKEKKKKYSESRSKIAKEMYESSSTDKFQQPIRKTNTVQDLERFDYGRRDAYETYPGEHTNGWYKDQQKKLRESPSRVSCALKKLLRSEYACVGCFAIVFAVTIVAGLLLVLRVMPSSDTMDDSNLMQSIKGKRQLSDYDIFGGRKYAGRSFDTGYQLPTFDTATEKKEYEYTDLPEQSSNDDIANILNGNEIMSSDNEKLRDFYKRLLETDSEIKRLKQNWQINYIKSRNSNQELERIKRSLNKTKARTVKQKSYKGNKLLNNMESKTRSKRLNNGTDVYGIVIQEQEIIFYEPKNSRKNVRNKNVSHKKHLKHPIRKNKQNTADSIIQNKIDFKEYNSYSNNTETSAAENDEDKINYLSTLNVDTMNMPSFESLDILSNITLDKDENYSQNSKNIIPRKIVLSRYDKPEKLDTGNTSKAITRKGRSLMYLENENGFTETKRKGIEENKFTVTNDTGYGNYKYRLRRLFQYYDTRSGDLVIAPATREKSSVENLKVNIQNYTGEEVNKVSNNIEGHNTNFNTTYFTNKTEVKRETDRKSVYIDGFYDDNEYGVNLDDYLDKKIRRDGYSTKSKMQKSKDWFKARMYKLTNRRNKAKKADNGLSTKAMNVEERFHSLPNSRKIRTLGYDSNKDMDNIFKKLNAKMETVCREAAYAIQNTRNIKVRESKADITTSTLMQRLVRMMRDLVDIQVQERTCVELPPDLRKFLEWLVPPSEENPQEDNMNPDISDYIAVKREYDKSDLTEQPISFAQDTDQAEVDKIQCMETIRAVQDLVDQYEGLSSDDKNKLFGVKDYLQHQLQYLNKLVSDDVENYNLNQDPEERLKRETNNNKQKRKFAFNMKNNKIRKFVNRLRMKHTKATTKPMETKFANNFTVKDKEIISITSQIQKSVYDAYNKALEEAKRISTEDFNITVT